MPEPISADSDYQEAFERYWIPVFRFALAWTNDWQAAEDLAQDAFLRLWVKRATFDWRSPILPWLLTTTRRLATDRFRRLRRAARLTVAHASPEPEGDALVRWLDVQSSLVRLTPVQRSALVMTAVMGFDTERAASALGVTPGAVRAAISRARAKLVEE